METIKKMGIKNSSQQLFNLYQFYVELADRISQRRGRTNTFFLSIISSFIGFIGFVSPFMNNTIKESAIYLICFFGIMLCFIWYISINSYTQLSKLKFAVIQEIEQRLIFPCFTREWQLLKENKMKYYRLSKIEKFVPLLFIIPFIFILIFSLI